MSREPFGINKTKYNIKRTQVPSKRRTVSVYNVLAVIGCVLATIVAYLGYKGYLYSRINTPLNVPKIVSENLWSSYWGSYRSGVYFGLKEKSPNPGLLAGLMWLLPDLVTSRSFPLRHTCEQSDDLDSYGWLQHDGRRFGVQEILEKKVKLTTSFVVQPEGRNWKARVRAEPRWVNTTSTGISIFFYFTFDEGALGWMSPVFQSDSLIGIEGNFSDKSKPPFQVMFRVISSSGDIRSFHLINNREIHEPLQQSVMKHLKIYGKNIIGFISDRDSGFSKEIGTNLIVKQVISNLPFEIEVEYVENYETPSLNNFSESINILKREFETKFEQIFQLAAKGYDSKDVLFAQSAMSNLIGGIGYFSGRSLVQSEENIGPVPYWHASLLTAVPSRSFFPRGFLWDEGFHNLLISKWSLDLSLEITSHWLDLINIEGWIPREQILGQEAVSKVPIEFVVQRSSHANPPTLFLTLYNILEDSSSTLNVSVNKVLSLMWPRLEAWYNWLNTTQLGEIPGTYRWRGRNGSAIHELNPKTLSSGFDDFPRASHPDINERHVDLRSWMAMASKVMSIIASRLPLTSKSSKLKYMETAEMLSDNELIDKQHWSEMHGSYLDYGLHSDDVVLKRPKRSRSSQNQGPPQTERVVRQPATLQFVNNIGYVGLFPFLLQIISPNSPKLGRILLNLKDPDVLYTPFGLRSLSRKSPMYLKRNTEHDPPYWRGPIWINMNFLALRALKFYSKSDIEPYAALAKEIYSKLRSNIVGNLIKEYRRTGYLWEQYDDRTGHGQGCRPFTGWSSLVVLIMAEDY